MRKSWDGDSPEEKDVIPSRNLNRKCFHEFPCTCDEYLNRLTQDQLINLRVQLGKVVTDPQKAMAAGFAICMFVASDPSVGPRRFYKAQRKEAIKAVEKTNKVLSEKFGYIII